jgi:hypothetical protein
VIPIISYTLVKCVIDDVDEVAAEPVKRYGKTQKWYRRITVHTESGEAFELLLEAYGKQPLELRRKSYFEWLIPYLFKPKNMKWLVYRPFTTSAVMDGSRGATCLPTGKTPEIGGGCI